MQGMEKEKFFSQDLFGNSILFDFSSTTVEKKSLIFAENKNGLLFTKTVTKFKEDSTLSTHKIVDLISYVRQHIGFSTSETFSTAINSVFNSVQQVTEHETIQIL